MGMENSHCIGIPSTFSILGTSELCYSEVYFPHNNIVNQTMSLSSRILCFTDELANHIHVCNLKLSTKVTVDYPRLGRHTPGVVEYEIHRILQDCLHVYLPSGRIAETIDP